MSKLKQVLKKKNTVCQDSPENADDYTVELKDGDIIVSATDGVFDNLFQHEVLSMVSDYRKTQEGGLITRERQAQELAKIMVDAAVDKFKAPKGKKTPYQRKYKKTYNATWEVSTILFNFNQSHSTNFREAKKMTSQSSCPLPGKSALFHHQRRKLQELTLTATTRSSRLRLLKNTIWSDQIDKFDQFNIHLSTYVRIKIKN
jgi:hypothetical protein